MAMSIDAARARAAALARAAAVLAGRRGAEPEAIPDTVCLDLQPPGGISVGARVWLLGPGAGEALSTLIGQWVAEGCTVLEDRRQPPVPTVLVGRPDDGFWLRAMVNLHGELAITVTSPCTWPEQP